jgi:hypothetical protein
MIPLLGGGKRKKLVPAKAIRLRDVQKKRLNGDSAPSSH